MTRSSTTVLPLLEGIAACRNPSKIVQEALTRWEAWQTIRRAVQRWVTEFRQGRNNNNIGRDSHRPRKRRKRRPAGDNDDNDDDTKKEEWKASTETKNGIRFVVVGRTTHWLWNALWESSVATERRAAAHIVARALEEHSHTHEDDDIWWMKYRLVRLFCEFHCQQQQQENSNTDDDKESRRTVGSLLLGCNKNNNPAKKDPRRILEGIVWLFDVLYGNVVSPSASASPLANKDESTTDSAVKMDTTQEKTTDSSSVSSSSSPAAFLLACHRSLGILHFWTHAVWETSLAESCQLRQQQHAAILQTAQAALWQALFQWFIQTDRPSDVVWLNKLRQELWKKSNHKNGNSTAWTPLAYLIAAKVGTENSPLVKSLESSRKVATASKITITPSSSSSALSYSKVSGAPLDLLMSITDPFAGSIRVVKAKLTNNKGEQANEDANRNKNKTNNTNNSTNKNDMEESDHEDLQHDHDDHEDEGDDDHDDGDDEDGHHHHEHYVNDDDDEDDDDDDDDEDDDHHPLHDEEKLLGNEQMKHQGGGNGDHGMGGMDHDEDEDDEDEDDEDEDEEEDEDGTYFRERARRDITDKWVVQIKDSTSSSCSCRHGRGRCHADRLG